MIVCVTMKMIINDYVPDGYDNRHWSLIRDVQSLVMTITFIFPRCQSLKLSECIRLQGDEIQKIDELRKQLRECKYKTIIVTEERDAKFQELKELTKWAEVLKTRFDVVEKEKQSSMEKTEVVSNNCVFLQETVRLDCRIINLLRMF